MAQDSIVIEVDEDKKLSASKPESALIDWIMGRVNPWVEYRDTNYKDRWNEYYRLWRGIWAPEDKSRDSERSKLISPALQQAVEVAVSEIEEATFGKGKWFDIDDDKVDTDNKDIAVLRKLLHEDLNKGQFRAAMSEVFFNGTLYGTGIGKLAVEEYVEYTVDPEPRESALEEPNVISKTKLEVKLVPVELTEFAIDPTARNIEEALGCAHIMMVPKHGVIRKQADGIYRPGTLGNAVSKSDTSAKGEYKDPNDSDRVKIVEYHGLVPEKLYVAATLEEGEELVDLGTGEINIEEEDMVEVIVTIGNDTVLLKVVENPFMMKDRCFLAYQHETVPGKFHGRGIAEKGYNPQKALDAELRGRIDAMAMAIHPMMGIDSTRIPRGFDMSIKPGKNLFTIGDPNQVLRPFNFNGVTQATFSQSGELERMLQMGTGSMDSAAPIGVSPRNATASGMSMIASGSIKRSKRTMANIERSFTEPLVAKAAWRYMQYDPERYPIVDVKFKVYSTLGIMAREYEQGVLTQLLQTAQPGSPEYWMLIRGIYQNSSISDKDEMLELVNQQLQSSLKPAPDPMQMMEMKLKMAESRREDLKLSILVSQAQDEGIKKMAEAILAIAKAESEEVGAQLNSYKQVVESLKPQTGEASGQTSTEGI